MNRNAYCFGIDLGTSNSSNRLSKGDKWAPPDDSYVSALVTLLFDCPRHNLKYHRERSLVWQKDVSDAVYGTLQRLHVID
jgi:hypothetical protein